MQPSLFTENEFSFFQNERLARIRLHAIKRNWEWGYGGPSTCDKAEEEWYFFDRKDENYKRGDLRVARCWTLIMTKEQEENPYRVFVDYHRESMKRWKERKIKELS